MNNKQIKLSFYKFLYIWNSCLYIFNVNIIYYYQFLLTFIIKDFIIKDFFVVE